MRSTIYAYADKHLGYYDAGKDFVTYVVHNDDKGEADQEGENYDVLEDVKCDLKVRVLFKTEENALHFESEVRNQCNTPQSYLNGLSSSSSVNRISTDGIALGDRIFTFHYKPQDSDSPVMTASVYSFPNTVYQVGHPLFIYQRIEHDGIFRDVYGCEGCHLMSKSHCIQHPSCKKYDADDNNRLALSSDMHSFFDGRNCSCPLFNLNIKSASEEKVHDGRYEVKLNVVAFNANAKEIIFPRLKGTQSSDPLVWETIVYVSDVVVFRTCLEWKTKRIQNEWEKMNI